MELERRFYELTDQADDLAVESREAEAPKIRGLAAAYGKWSVDLGGFREIINPGAFDRVLSKRNLDVVALFDHDGQPLARTIGGSLRLSSADRGLAYDFDIPDTQLGRDVSTLVRSKILFGSSFAFTVEPKGEAWNQDERGNTTRTITEFSGLYDVSVVTRAAYGSATSVAVRSLERWRQENLTSQEIRRLNEQAREEVAAVAAISSIQKAKARAAAALVKVVAYAGRG